MPLSTAANCEYTTTNIPAFLSKLWTLVEDPKYNELIAWDPSGFSFHVFDQTSFSREILPRFFKHNNMASFIRQLNMYGFRKVNSIDHGSLKNEKEDMEFHHPYFIKGKEQFLEYIKRKVPDVKPVASNALSTTNNITSTTPQLSNQQQSSVLSLQQYSQIKPDELNKMLDDVNTMKSKQKMVDDSLFNVKKENEALWKEIASLRQKHHHQQQIVNKLIHFLVHLVNPSSIGLKRSRPLMIDSHTAAALVNSATGASKFGTADSNDDQYTDNDNDEDEEFIINDSNRRQFIELEEDDEESELNNQNNIRTNFIEENESSSSGLSPISTTVKTTSSKNRLNYINDTEIETINNAKTTSSNLDQVIVEPAFKRLRRLSNSNSSLSSQLPIVQQQQQTQQQQQAQQNQQHHLNQPQIQQQHKVKDLRQQINTHSNMGNIFLKDNSNLGTMTSEVNSSNSILDDQHQTHMNSLSSINMINTPPLSLSNTQTNSPIVSMPASPNLVNNTKNLINSNELNSNTNNIIDLTVNDSIVSPSSGLKRSISSSNQMNDHVESLQLDLNSIKDFLTSTSFNSIDSYTINNLFSPINLDQSDIEPNYIEAPLLSNSVSQNIQLPTNLINNNTNNSSSTNNNINNNGRIVGNEVIQYEPYMPLDFLAFNADDLISVGEESEEVKSNEMKLAGDISTINSPADFISTNTLNANQDKNWSKIEDLNNNSNHVNEDLFE